MHFKNVVRANSTTFGKFRQFRGGKVSDHIWFFTIFYQGGYQSLALAGGAIDAEKPYIILMPQCVDMPWIIVFITLAAFHTG